MYGRRKTYRCGGYGSYTGHCGALDCETCHPGGAAAMAREEEVGPLEERLSEIEARMDEIDQLDESEITDALESEYKALETEADDLRDQIDSWSDEYGFNEPDWESIAEARAEARAEAMADRYDW